MIKQALNSIVRVNSRRLTQLPANKRQWIQEMTLNEHKSAGFNPRKARHKSVKEISFLTK